MNLAKLLHDSQTPFHLANINLALLTIFIPLAIAFFSSQTIGLKFQELDRRILLNFIFKAKLFYIYFALLFVPVLSWSVFKSYIYKLILLLSWSLGVYFILSILYKAYKWAKGNDWEIRLKYFKKLKNKI